MISINFGNKSSVKREKGKSLVELPSNFTVIDIETTGYDSKYDSIKVLSSRKLKI